MEVKRKAVEVGLEVDLGREPAARASERLVFLPPFAPAADTWAREIVLSKNWITSAEALRSARSCKNASKTPERLSRQKRFQTLFHFPYSAGKARQEMLCTVK
jgi:hypothetical protein